MSYLHKMLVPKVLLTSSSRLAHVYSYLALSTAVWFSQVLREWKCWDKHASGARCETQVSTLVYYLIVSHLNPAFLKMTLASSFAMLRCVGLVKHASLMRQRALGCSQSAKWETLLGRQGGEAVVYNWKSWAQQRCWCDYQQVRRFGLNFPPVVAVQHGSFKNGWKAGEVLEMHAIRWRS